MIAEDGGGIPAVCARLGVSVAQAAELLEAAAAAAAPAARPEVA
jgi:hypothetical protein